MKKSVLHSAMKLHKRKKGTLHIIGGKIHVVYIMFNMIWVATFTTEPTFPEFHSFFMREQAETFITKKD